MARRQRLRLERAPAPPVDTAAQVAALARLLGLPLPPAAPDAAAPPGPPAGAPPGPAPRRAP